MLNKIIFADVSYLWQSGFQNQASISMEGILTFNKHLTFLLLILISLFFLSVFMIFYCCKVFEFIGCMLEIRAEDIESYLESDRIDATKILKSYEESRNETKEMAETRDAEIDERLCADWISAADIKKILKSYEESRNETKEMAETRDAEIDDFYEIYIAERLRAERLCADWISAADIKKILKSYEESRNETEEMAEIRDAEIDDFYEIYITERLRAERLCADWISAADIKKILKSYEESRNETEEMAEIRDAEIDDFYEIYITERLRADWIRDAEIDDFYEIYIERFLAAEIQKWEGLYEKVVSLNDGLWFSEACLYYTRIGKSLPQAFPEFFINKGYLFVIEYLPILVYFLIAVLLSYVILCVSYTLVVQKPETEKTSGYECGFETYEDARHKFNVRFYLLAILFILFDIETMFLIPWCVTLSLVNYIGYLVMMEFILELLLGFLYVWYVGGLDWE